MKRTFKREHFFLNYSQLKQLQDIIKCDHLGLQFCLNLESENNKFTLVQKRLKNI